MATILIIEDEPELVRGLESYLQRAGFETLAAYRGDSGLEAWRAHEPDLILLDLNLPGMDGLDVARAIRREADTPIIMISARIEETDRLIGLELGADDYIVKPYSPREVVARVRTVLRRVQHAVTQPEKLTHGDLVIDIEGHRVLRAGDEINLTPTEFKLLEKLARHPGRAFNRLQLLEAAQGEAYEGYERTIDAHIKNLRAKVQRADDPEPLIETVFGVGYRFQESS